MHQYTVKTVRTGKSLSKVIAVYDTQGEAVDHAVKLIKAKHYKDGELCIISEAIVSLAAE